MQSAPAASGRARIPVDQRRPITQAGRRPLEYPSPAAVTLVDLFLMNCEALGVHADPA